MQIATALVAALQITFFPHGHAGGSHAWSFRCGPAGGTHPHPSLACSELRSHPRFFAPQPACTRMIRVSTPYAVVRGRVDGRPVSRTINPTCSFADWRALHVLLTGS